MGLNSVNKDKDPDSEEWFAVDWEKYLSTGDSVAAGSSWELSAGLTEMDKTIDGTKMKVKLSGGVVGTVEKATAKLVTSLGEKNDETLEITIVEK